VRLDAGTTKNKEGCVFVMTDDLRVLLVAQQSEHERLKKAGHICPYVFFPLVADERGGEKKPRQVKAFTKAWKNACRAAGCPGRIPHDLRRTAVRNMVRRGIPERVAMKLTGHKTRSVFDRYNIVSDGDLHTAAASPQRAGEREPTTGPTRRRRSSVTHGTRAFLNEVWRRRPDLNRGWRFCRFSEKVYRVDSSCFLVSAKPSFYPGVWAVLDPRWTQVSSEVFLRS
jgi:hypothetical protein